MKSIAILGSTGSIGTQTLDIVARRHDLRVTALAAGRNVSLLEQQIRRFRPSVAAVWEESDAKTLRTKVADLPVRIVSGMDGLLEVAVEKEAEMLVTAIVGMLGIRPTIAAIEAGKDIALANKETLVTAGHLIMPLAKRHQVSILPVDSEHSAIFQSLQGQRDNEIYRILLTASGGPFLGRSLRDLEQMTPADALKHPNWSMGKKITIDSATMVNKGLEVMEAKWLFGVELSRIQVVVHPQSILHSAVEFEDGAVIGQMGVPDMRLPILYALYYPQRQDLCEKRLDLFDVGTLTFQRPDVETFYGLALAYDAMEAGGNVPTVYNAANERAVAKFLDGKIAFTDIGQMISDAMTEVAFVENPNLEDILNTEKETYEYIESRW